MLKIGGSGWVGGPKKYPIFDDFSKILGFFSFLQVAFFQSEKWTVIVRKLGHNSNFSENLEIKKFENLLLGGGVPPPQAIFCDFLGSSETQILDFSILIFVLQQLIPYFQG